MKKLAYALAALLVLLVGTLGVLYLVFVHPWVASPDASPEEIAGRWAQVEAWADPGQDCDQGGAVLRLATRSADRGWWEVETRFEGEGIEVPRLERGELSFELRSAVDGLVGWHRSGEGIGLGTCEPDDDLVAGLNLVRLALATAEDAGSPELAAVLALGQAYRGCGPLIRSMMGFTIASDAVDWARSRGVPPGELFERYRPTADEVFGGLAREAVCSHRMAEQAFEPAALDQGSLGAPSLAAPLVGVDRELGMLQLFYADHLEVADAAGRDPRAMVEIYAWDDLDDLPPSLLVRLTSLSGGVVERLVEHLEEYDAFLAGEAMEGDG